MKHAPVKQELEAAADPGGTAANLSLPQQSLDPDLRPNQIMEVGAWAAGKSLSVGLSLSISRPQRGREIES